MTVLSTTPLTEDFSTHREVEMSEVDHELLGQLRTKFCDQHLVSLRRLEVEFEQESVTLRGTVASFYERQLAITCTRKVIGDRQIIDQIEVP